MMAILAAIVLWFVAGIFVLLIALLVVPFRVQAICRTEPELVYRVYLRVPGGISPRIALIDSARPRKPKSRKSKPKRKHSGGQRRWSANHVLPAAMQLVSGLLRAIHLDHFRLDATFGLSDPADTGQLFGCLTPLQFGGMLPRHAVVFLQPDFGCLRFSCEIDTEFKVRLVAVFAPVARFAWQIYGPGR